MRFVTSLFLSIIFHLALLFSDKISLLKTKINHKVDIPAIKIQIQNSKKEIDQNSRITVKSFQESAKVVDLNKAYSKISQVEQDFYEKIRSLVYNKWHGHIKNNYDDFQNNKLKETIVAFKMNKNGAIIDKMIQVPSISKIADQIALSVLDSSMTLPAPPRDVMIGHDFIVLIMGFSIK